MKREVNLDHVLDSWFIEGPTNLPDRTVAAIAEQLDDVHQRGPLGLPGRLSMPRFVPALATAAIVLVVGVVAWGVFVNRPGVAVNPSTTSSASPAPSPAPSTSHLPSPSPSPTSGRPADAPATDDVVHAWPGNNGSSLPGLYSWDVDRRCGGDCIFGRIHNHRNAQEDRNADITISISMVSTPPPDEGGTAVTVASHPGTYYRVDGMHEIWRVVIQGTTIEIDLEAQPGASQAELDEAHAIIDSMRTESSDNSLGFRIVFRLETSYWDSPF